MQLTDLAGVFLTQHAAPVDQHPQQLDLRVVDDGAKPGHANPD